MSTTTTASSIEEDVMRIKKRLDKMMKSNEVDVAVSIDMLKTLKKSNIDLQILKTTGIGVVLNNLRKSCNSEELGTLAKGLLKNWKKLVNNETTQQQQQVNAQALSPNSNSNDSTSAIKQPTSPSPPPPANVTNGNGNGASTTSPPTVKSEPTATGGVKRSLSEFTDSQTKRENSEAPRKVQRSSSFSETKDPIRLKCREMLASALEIPEPNEYSSNMIECVEIACKCEDAIFGEFKNTDVKYKNRVRSRVINLKDARNPKLRESVRLGYIAPEKLASMTPEEMASDEMKKLRERLTKEAIDDHQMARTQGAKTSLLKCNKCKKNNVVYSEMQTRSADEPMTTFAYCEDCGHRWKFC